MPASEEVTLRATRNKYEDEWATRGDRGVTRARQGAWQGAITGCVTRGVTGASQRA